MVIYLVTGGCIPDGDFVRLIAGCDKFSLITEKRLVELGFGFERAHTDMNLRQLVEGIDHNERAMAKSLVELIRYRRKGRRKMH